MMKRLIISLLVITFACFFSNSVYGDQMDSYDEKASFFKEKMKALARKNEDFLKKVREKIGILKEENVNNKEIINGLEKEVAIFREESINSKRTIKGLKEKNVKLEDKVKGFDLQAKANKKDVYERTIDDLKEKIVVFRKDKIGNKQTIRDLEREMTAFKEKNADNKRIIKSMEDENIQLKKRVKKLSFRTESYQKTAKLEGRKKEVKNSAAGTEKSAERKDIEKEKYKIYYNLGSLYAQKNNIDKAIQNFKLALYHNSEDEDVYFNLGYLYALKGDFKDAVNEYNKVLAIDPYCCETYLNLALLYYNNLKDEIAAENYYRKFLELSREKDVLRH